MDEFKVNLGVTKNALEAQVQIGKQLNKIEDELSSIRKSLRFKIAQRANIERNLNILEDNLNGMMNKNATVTSVLSQIMEKYEQTEAGLVNIDGDGKISAGQDVSDTSFWEELKALCTWFDTIYDNDQAGIINDGLSYFESLYKFFTGDMSGLTGTEDWLDLLDNSIGLWTGFYDYLKNFYNEMGDLFSNGNQEKVAGLGIIGGIAGLIRDLFGAVDTISNTEGIGAAGITGEIINLFKNGADIWEGAEELLHIGDESINITTKSGIYSPLSFYSAIIKGYVSTLSQGFSSIEKYAADGSWSLDDTGATGIEASVAGLYSMVNTLTFGIISEGTTGISAEDISNYVENSGRNIGTRAGNYIVSNPELNQKYQEANGAGKVAITFYAAICSVWS